MSTAATAAIEVAGLARAYGERWALGGIEFRVAPGQTLAVLGPNGAGKSTLLRVLATLLRPHRGEVRVLGAALPREGWRIRGRVGLLAHDPLLYRDLTARENLGHNARLHRVPQQRVDELLEQVGMAARADEPLRLLSRGMVQRIAVCRAVIADPEVLLLDEARANLDPGAAELVEPLVGRAAGRARVLTSHDPAAALAEADIALGLRGGAQAWVLPAADVGPELVRELYT